MGIDCSDTVHKVLVVGVENVGKTTLLYKLIDPGRTVMTVPTVGKNVRTA